MSSNSDHSTSVHRRWRVSALLTIVLLAVGATAGAQPFGEWLRVNGSDSPGYIAIPASPTLNPTDAFTFEAWVSIINSLGSEDCRSIAGKDYKEAWWIGLCTVGGKPTLRSYLKGTSSARSGGEIEQSRWTHVAVVFDGAKRYHYINGELAATFDETGPLTTSADPMRIGSDVSWAFPPAGDIDEVRLWNVARTQAQIRGAMSRELTAPESGLVAVWPLNGNAADVVGPNDGTANSVGFNKFSTGSKCVGNSGSLCLLERFIVSARFRTDPAGKLTNGDARVVNAPNAGSGLFWFFNGDNWEILVKSLNGCGVNNRYWLFSAATTNVFYRMEVRDVRTGTQKIYFNYPGPPAPAVTDTDAFATCP